MPVAATPHNGDKEAFDNLFGLLDPKFEGLSEMPEGQRRKDRRDGLGNYVIGVGVNNYSQWLSRSVAATNSSIGNGPPLI